MFILLAATWGLDQRYEKENPVGALEIYLLYPDFSTTPSDMLMRR